MEEQIVSVKTATINKVVKCVRHMQECCEYRSLLFGAFEYIHKIMGITFITQYKFFGFTVF